MHSAGVILPLNMANIVRNIQYSIPIIVISFSIKYENIIVIGNLNFTSINDKNVIVTEPKKSILEILLTKWTLK